MRIADQRMYAPKNAGRMSAARQAHDVLLRRARLAPIPLRPSGLRRPRAPPVSLRDECEAVRWAVELHPLGEDVIAAAPSLRPVARLVAESHAPESPAAHIVAAQFGARAR